MILVLCSLIGVMPLAQADSLSDRPLDDAYMRCLLKRRVEPPEIPKADDEYCLRDVGIADPGEEERRDRGNAWRACLAAQAARLDDQVSPAGEIGQAVIALCVNEWRGYAGSLWMFPGAKRRFVNEIERNAAGEGVRAVLLSRKAQREKERK